MDMKQIYRIFAATLLLACIATAGCKEEYTTYKDAEYVMFADTLSTHMVLQDQEYFQVAVASTTSCGYDRTFSVEIIDKGSNAIEGKHYRLRTPSVTIPAGKRVAHVEVEGIYDNIEATDSLGFILKLVTPEAVKWDLYPDRTKVVMYKSCPFSPEEFTGWCVVTSMFLNSYPGSENRSMQRLIYTSLHPTEENTVIFHNWLFTGYDIRVRLNPEDPADPTITIEEDQVLSDEVSVFGQINGDNRILIMNSPYTDSYYNTCQRYATISMLAYVEDLGELVGSVGEFFNVMEWVSDEEADRLDREEGLKKIYPTVR